LPETTPWLPPWSTADHQLNEGRPHRHPPTPLAGVVVNFFEIKSRIFIVCLEYVWNFGQNFLLVSILGEVLDFIMKYRFFFGVNFGFIFSNDDGLCGILGSGFQLIQSNLLELVSFEAWHCYCCVN